MQLGNVIPDKNTTSYITNGTTVTHNSNAALQNLLTLNGGALSCSPNAELNLYGGFFSSEGSMYYMDLCKDCVPLCFGGNGLMLGLIIVSNGTVTVGGWSVALTQNTRQSRGRFWNKCGSGWLAPSI